MSSFIKFPSLPTELRLEIWRMHFAECHGTQMHIFHSTPQGVTYTNQDAASGEPGYNTLAAARVCREAWDVFGKSFHVGDTGALLPQSSLQDARGRLIDHEDDDGNDNGGSTQTGARSLRGIYAAAAREELRKRSVEFALGSKDMVYIVDKDMTSLLVALSAAPWARHVKRLGVQILNFVVRPPDQMPRRGRWVRWNALLSAPPERVERFLGELRDLVFVVVPNTDVRRFRYLPLDAYGCVAVDPGSFDLGSADECSAVRTHVRAIRTMLCEVFPQMEGKIGCVADTAPERVRFSIY